MPYRALIFALLIPIAFWQLLSSRPVDRAPGVLAPDDPQQITVAVPDIEKDGASLTPHAKFSAKVRVLSRERYWLGKMGDIVPLDIAVGWGRMSDSDVLKDLEISQSNRFYYWHYEQEPPIPREEIISHSANWHLIPANSSAWRALKGLRVGDVVTLEGQLVDVDVPDVGKIMTSLTREDSGAGACEVMLVEHAFREQR